MISFRKLFAKLPAFLLAVIMGLSACHAEQVPLPGNPPLVEGVFIEYLCEMPENPEQDYNTLREETVRVIRARLEAAGLNAVVRAMGMNAIHVDLFGLNPEDNTADINRITEMIGEPGPLEITGSDGQTVTAEALPMVLKMDRMDIIGSASEAAAVPVICPECGAEYPEGTEETFCPNCGAALLEKHDAPAGTIEGTWLLAEAAGATEEDTQSYARAMEMGLEMRYTFAEGTLAIQTRFGELEETEYRLYTLDGNRIIVTDETTGMVTEAEFSLEGVTLVITTDARTLTLIRSEPDVTPEENSGARES